MKHIRPILTVTAVLVLATLCLCTVGCDTNNLTYRYDTSRFVGTYSLNVQYAAQPLSRGILSVGVYKSTVSKSEVGLYITDAPTILFARQLVSIDTTGYSYYSTSKENPGLARVDQEIDPAIVTAVNDTIKFIGTRFCLDPKDRFTLLDSGQSFDYSIYSGGYGNSLSGGYLSILDTPYALFDVELDYVYKESKEKPIIHLYVINQTVAQDGTTYWYSLTWYSLDKQ